MLSWIRQSAWDQVPHSRRLWRYAIALVVMFLLVVPSLVVIPMSFSASRYLEFPPSGYSLDWYRALFGSAEWLSAIRTSLTVAVLTVLLATPSGTLAAYVIIQARRRPATAMQGLLLVPMLVPIIMIGVGLFYLYVRLGLLNTVTGLVLAHSMLALPLVMVTVLAGFRTCDMNQEMVARSLGAPRPVAFVTVTLPQIRRSVLTAMLLAFLTSLDEVIIAIFIAGGDRSTITRLMFSSLRDEIDPVIAAISTCLILVSIVCVLIIHMLSTARAGGRGT